MNLTPNNVIHLSNTQTLTETKHPLEKVISIEVTEEEIFEKIKQDTKSRIIKQRLLEYLAESFQKAEKLKQTKVTDIYINKQFRLELMKWFDEIEVANGQSFLWGAKIKICEEADVPFFKPELCFDSILENPEKYLTDEAEEVRNFAKKLVEKKKQS